MIAVVSSGLKLLVWYGGAPLSPPLCSMDGIHHLSFLSLEYNLQNHLYGIESEPRSLQKEWMRTGFTKVLYASLNTPCIIYGFNLVFVVIQLAYMSSIIHGFESYVRNVSVYMLAVRKFKACKSHLLLLFIIFAWSYFNWNLCLIILKSGYHLQSVADIGFILYFIYACLKRSLSKPNIFMHWFLWVLSFIFN